MKFINDKIEKLQNGQVKKQKITKDTQKNTFYYSFEQFLAEVLPNKIGKEYKVNFGF